MAFIEKRGERWRVQIRRRGVEQSRTFRTKAQAREWALQVEAGITGESVPFARHSVAEGMQRYAKEVSTTKRGGRWERIRLNALSVGEFSKKAMSSVTEEHVAAWRDARLRGVSPSTVRREMNLLQDLFEVARREWKWVRVNPFRGVRKPPEPPARRRGVTVEEFKAIASQALTDGEKQVLAGFELAIETGMRAGEIWSLTPEQIDLKHCVARLEKTKNGDSRDVALSPRAVEILRETRFTISNAVRDVLFRRMRDRANLPTLHFHDSRSEAVSRLSKVLRVQDLADQIGHRDLNSLMFYYKPSARDRAKQLAKK